MLHNEQKQQAALQKGLPVFYYYSSDPFLARAAAEETAAALLQEEGESTRLDGPAPTVEELVMAAGTISFFGTRRIVELPMLQPSAYSEKDMAEFCDVLASTENAVFVIYSVFSEERGKLKLSKQAKKLIETCETLGYAAEVAHPGVQELRRMLRQRAEGMNTAMSESAAGLLLERCGQDLFLLENEVDKLAAASGYTEITPGLIVEMSTQNLEADVFDMVRLITGKNAAKACEKLNTLLRLQNDPIAITAAMIGSYVDLYRVKAGLAVKKSYGQVHKDLGYKGSDYRLKKSAETAARYTLPQLEQCLEILLELDQGLKGSPTDSAVLLQTTLCRLAAAGVTR